MQECHTMMLCDELNDNHSQFELGFAGGIEMSGTSCPVLYGCKFMALTMIMCRLLLKIT